MNVKMCLSVPQPVKDLIVRTAGRMGCGTDSGAVERMALFTSAVLDGQVDDYVLTMTKKDRLKDAMSSGVAVVFVFPWPRPAA